MEPRQVFDDKSSMVFVADFHVTHQIVVLGIMRAQHRTYYQSGPLAGVLRAEVSLVGVERAYAV